jgi:integrase
MKERWVEKNCFDDVQNLRIQKHEPNPFTRDELSRIFQHLDDHLRPYFLLQAATGMRTGELMARRW